MNQKIQYELGNHKKENVIFIRFDYDVALIERVKKLVGVRWSQSQKSWYVLDNQQNRTKFRFEQKPAGEGATEKIHAVNEAAYQRFLEQLQLKAYSPNTIRTYRNEFAQLLYVLKENAVDSLTHERLRSYFLYCINELKLSENTLHSRINAIKFYFEQVLRREKLTKK